MAQQWAAGQDSEIWINHMLAWDWCVARLLWVPVRVSCSELLLMQCHSGISMRQIPVSGPVL